MLSVTATTSPAWTSSPAATGIATTTPGAWLRTRPPSSRETRCGTPSTSTSRSRSCSAVIVRYERAAEAQPALVLGDLLDLGLDARAVDLDAVARAGPVWQTVKR